MLSYFQCVVSLNTDVKARGIHPSLVNPVRYHPGPTAALLPLSASIPVSVSCTHSLSRPQTRLEMWEIHARYDLLTKHKTKLHLRHVQSNMAHFNSLSEVGNTTLALVPTVWYSLTQVNMTNETKKHTKI